MLICSVCRHAVVPGTGGLKAQNCTMFTLISSMATRLLLADLTALWMASGGMPIAVESVGGLDAAKRIQSGEAFDGVVLAADAIDKLILGRHVAAGSRVDLARSSVAVAVRAGSPLPDISTEEALRQAVVAAPSVGYSTGPSGVAIKALFERWGLTQSPSSKFVQTPPGVPVGSLVARGELALGFQQLSELMHLDGIAVVGTLPDTVAITTVFSAGICTKSRKQQHTAEFFSFIASSHATAVKQRHGMTPV